MRGWWWWYLSVLVYYTVLYCTQYRDEGLVVVEGLFSSVELEEVSRQLMRRVEGREAGTRAEDLLNLHHTDPYIMGQWLVSPPHTSNLPLQSWPDTPPPWPPPPSCSTGPG